MKKKFSPLSSIWIQCLFGSLCIHFVLFYFLSYQSFTVSSFFPSLFQKSSPEITAKGASSFIIDTPLEDFFAEFSLYSQYKHPIHTKISSNPKPLSAEEFPVLSPLELPIENQFPALMSYSRPLIKEENAIPLPEYSPEELISLHPPMMQPSLISPQELLPEEDPVSLEQDRVFIEKPSSHAKKLSFVEEKSLTGQESPSLVFTEKPSKSSLAQEEKNLQPLTADTPSSIVSLSAPSALPTPEESLSPYSIASIEECLPLSNLFSLQWKNDVSISPAFLPCEDGYYFSLSVSSKLGALENRNKLHQTFYFLIDTSSSVEKHKVSLFKKSVLKSLATLGPSHSFNIFLLGKEVESFSPNALPYSLETQRRVEEFLEKEQSRTFFNSKDLFQKVSLALDEIDSSQDVHTVILLTNGASSSSLTEKSEALSNLLEKSAGRVQFFTAAVGKNNTLIHLHMLSSLCGGRMFYSDTNASFPRKLQTFLKKIQSPLLKDLTISLQTRDPKVDLQILSSPLQINCLYGETPVVIVGKMNRLSPIQVSLEGRSDEGWVLVQKEVLFEGAAEGGILFKKSLASIQATSLYTDFLKSPQKEQIQQAKDLFKVIHGQIGQE